MRKDLSMIEIKIFLKKYAHKWRWAKTYENFAPHEYLLMKDVHPNDRWVFPAMAKFIKKYGYKKKFFKKTYTYINIEGYKYWTMDYPLEKTDLINRAKIKAHQGRKWVVKKK